MTGSVLIIHEHNTAVHGIANFSKAFYKFFYGCIKIISLFELKTGTQNIGRSFVRKVRHFFCAWLVVNFLSIGTVSKLFVV